MTSPIRKAMEKLPRTDTAAYFLAVAHAPMVVATDTPESRFLAVEDGDATKAATRLAAYWRSRREIFRDRALLPMEQTGRGTLDSKEIDMWKTAVLVNAPKDASGRSVLVFDVSRLKPSHSYPSFDDVRLRLGFYVFSLAAENPLAQSVGVVAICLVTKAPRLSVHRKLMKLIKESLPIRSIEFHAVILPSRGTLGRFTQTILDFYQLALEPLTRIASIHRGETDDDVLEELERSGFRRSGLPEWVGGTWSENDFHSGRERRLDLERQRYLSDAERATMRREADALRARKKRERARVETGLLQHQVSALKAENEALRTEGQRLELLVNYATTMLFSSGYGHASTDDFR